jgi:hypothetical protein
MKLTRCVALAAVAGMASSAMAGPPTFVLTGQLGSDLSADGTTAVGATYDPVLGGQIVAAYKLGFGETRTGFAQDNDALRCSADGSVLAYTAYDLENVSGLGTTKLTPHVWTASTGETNYGISPWTQSCDAYTNSVGDLSGNGRYIIGGTYTVSTCGPFRGFRFDIQTNTWELLPTISGSRSSSATAVNSDGTVICGRDEVNPGQAQIVRNAVVWVKSGGTWTRTVLDPAGGSANAVSADGTAVVGTMSGATMYATFGIYDTLPIMWVRSGANWIPQVLGGDLTMVPLAVSADGSTVVGRGGDDDSGFIWRQSINGGVPMTLNAYVAQNLGVLPEEFTINAYIGSPVRALSDDGNSILVSLRDSRNPCLIWFPGAILDLDGGACEPARISRSPVSHYNPAGPAAEPFGMVFNCFITGSLDMDIRWQKESEPGSNVWVDLEDDNCGEYLPEYYNVRGTQTMQLRLGALDNTWAGRYRCVVTNDCGTETSRAFRVSTCLADLSCDQVVDLTDYFQFFNAFDQTTMEADMNDDGEVDLNDFFAFLNAFDTGC